jgi:phytoene dehydrogenase-like protein
MADGRAWLSMTDQWARVGRRFVRALLAPFPPVRAGAALLAAPPPDLAWLARTALTPVRRLGEELFEEEPGRALLAGLALHADLPPEAAGSGLFGWLLAGLAQDVGFPVPVGGAGELTTALRRRLEERGGTLRYDAPVSAVVVDRGRAQGVLAGDDFVPAARAVLATVTAPALYGRLLADTPLPDHIQRGLDRWQPGAATVKVDWALGRPVPWTDPRLNDAGTVHLADGVDDLSRYACALATRSLPDAPMVVVGQMTTADPTRSPAGTESAWAYTHVAQDPPDGDRWTPALVDRVVRTIEDTIEAKAPGFRDHICARYVQGPVALEEANANLIGGDLNAGTAQLHQQLVFRPFAGTARPETFVDGLYLAGASAHPGGGVHGAPGANAARAAVVHDRVRRLRRRLTATTGGAP